MKSSSAILLAGVLLAGPSFGQDANPLYQNSFEQAEVGKIPDDFLVLDGAFAVQQEGTNKFLELPGAPLDSYGVLFGPTEKQGVAACARAFGTTKGRQSPVFALGLNGVGGYRLQISPVKKLLELCRGETVKASVPYLWESGKWTRLRIQVQKAGTSWKVFGKAWTEGQNEPADWLISAEDTDDIPAGRAGFFCSPFSGTPIRVDDLLVSRIEEKK